MMWLTVSAVLCAAAAFLVRRRWTVVRVRGGSMEPALHDGAVLLARRWTGRPPCRGDIVVLRRPPVVAVPPGATLVHRAPGVPPCPGEGWLIKRVVAVPGDPVPPGVPNTEPGPVPQGTVIVYGDRPGLDSRLFGPAPIGTIHATVVRALR